MIKEHQKYFLTDHDIYLFKEGNYFKAYEKFGAHLASVDGQEGVCFSVWAPNAQRVSVIGDFNGWNPEANILKLRMDGSGVWEGFIPGISQGTLYKYHIISKFNNYRIDRGDPFANYWEVSPKTASIVWDLDYEWQDKKWMKTRHQANSLNSPHSVYEVHLGSWRRNTEENNRFLSYKEIAHQLADYVLEMGFTHVELLPIMEHPFYGSWGYQCLGYFAPTSRFGTPQDFMYFVDYLHQKGIGVILDWVPSHFPSDAHGLAYFDGTHLYEHADMRKGFHPEWKSYIFNYGRSEVRDFLVSSALFWLEKYHIDGLRVDAVASMLYLDYARKNGEWIPNQYGGHDNIEAIQFMRRLNEILYAAFPDIQMVAEESTSWSMVSRPVSSGGLGFGMKWNMGWMHDTLKYMSENPVNRKYHHNQLTFSMWYAFYENFILPLSHDEVVHGKGSLIGKMPGDEWQRFANLRLLFSYFYTHPGKKLLFMGGELGQWKEWNHETSLDWHILQYPWHSGINHLVKDLNHLYKNDPALHELDFELDGFRWIDFSDWQNSVISFLRKGKTTDEPVLVVCNFTPVPRYHYRLGCPLPGSWKEVLNSDAKEYYGSGVHNPEFIEAEKKSCHGLEYSLSLTLPPLGVLILKRIPAPEIKVDVAED